MEFSIRKVGSKTELDSAFAIRRKVFIEEQGFPIELEFDGFDDKAEHFLVFADGTAVGTARLLFVCEIGIYNSNDGWGSDAPKNIGKIEWFGVLKEWRDKGAGKALLKFVIDSAKAKKPRAIVLHAQKLATNFYGQFGFEECSDPFMHAGIEHVTMALVLA